MQTIVTLTLNPSVDKNSSINYVIPEHNEVIVVSLGAGGAFSISEAGMARVASPTVPIRSKVGAGDSMVAGIVLSLARGLSLWQAICFGVAAGAAAVMTLGTQLCRGEDARFLYESMISEKITV